MLTLTSDDGTAAVSIDYADVSDPDARQVFHYTITVEGEIVVDAEDLRSGANGIGGSLREGLASLVGFLGAWHEAINYGNESSENRDLFPMSAWEKVSPYIEEWECETADDS